MKNDNFYKTLRIVCLILAIVCMALSLLKKVNAAEYTNEDVKYYLHEYLDACGFDNVNYFDNNCSSNYDTCYYFEIGSGIYYQKVFIMCASNNTFNMGTLNINNNIYSSMRFYSSNYARALFSSVKYTTFGQTLFIISYHPNDNGGVYASAETWSTYNYRSTESGLYRYWTNSSYYTDASNNIPIKNQLPSNEYAINGDIYAYGNYVLKSGGNNIDDIENKFPHPPIVNTEGFDVYKYGPENNQRLVCDFTDCISISSTVSNSSTISLVVDIDSVENTLTFDSTSSYYYYGSLGNEAARYSFPFSALGITPNTINARLISVNIVNTTSSPGGSYNNNINWITPIALVGSNYEDETASVINKDNLPDYNKFDDPTTEQSYNETTNRWLTSTYNTLPLSLFNRWNFEVRYKVIPVYDEGLGSSALNAFLTALTQALNLQFGDVVQTAIELYNGHSIYEIIEDVLQNNNYSQYYDLVAFCYQDANGSDPVYYIYTTDTYNNHLTNSYLYDIMQTIYDDGKALDSIYNYLYDRLDDFETKSLNKMNEAVGLGEIENDLLEKIRKLLDQILSAILNLDLEVPEADYTDILSKLDTIIDNQDTSDINDDWYQNYREWLYGINENDSYLSPHEYFNNIFGTLKTTFDSFTNNISFNAYLLKVEDFINHISGSTTDNLTIYLRDGIGDPGFNINNNYMYTVGGSQ